MQNVKTVCYHIDWQWQVFSPLKRQFNATNLDTIISETKDLFGIILCIFQIYINFEHSQKKDDPHSRSISKIIVSEKAD